MPSPDVDRIMRRAELGKQRLQVFFAAFEESERLYDGEWEPAGPPDFPRTTPATASAIIDEATDHVDTWNLRAVVPTLGRTVDAENRAGVLKQFIQGMWEYWNTHGSDLPPLRDAARNGFLGDKMIGKVMVDWDRWPEPDIKKGTTVAQKDQVLQDIRAIRAMNFPIFVQTLSPRYFIDDPTIGRKKWGLEFYNKTTDAMHERFPGWKLELAEKEEEPLDVEMIEYWEEGEEKGKKGVYRVFVLQGALAAPPKFLEGYPLPYVVKYAGLGRESYDGRHEKKARGLLHPVKSLLYAEGRRLTQLDVITSFYASPPLVAEGEVGDYTLRWEPGYLNFVPTNKSKPEAINIPTPHAALLATIGEIRRGIERSVGQPVLRGSKPQGTRTAGELEVLSAQASLRFLAVTNAVADFAKQVDEKAMLLLRNVILKKDDVVTIPTIDDSLDAAPKLRRSQIPDPFYHKIELGDTSPEGRARQGLAAMEKLNMGFIDKETALEEAGYTNTAEIKYKSMRDKVLGSPLVITLLGKDFANEYLGVDVDELAFEEALKELESQGRLQQAAGGQGGGINQAASATGVSRNAGGGGVPTALQGFGEEALQ